MKKRGQVTLFIIIGMLILILTSIGFFWINYLRTIDRRVITDEIKPVTNYVDLCVEATARDAVERLGLQGGYIDIPDSILNNPYAYIVVFLDNIKINTLR